MRLPGPPTAEVIDRHERRFRGFDDRVVALNARGLTVREIQAFLTDMSGVDVSPDLISTVTDGVEGMSEALGAVFPATTLQTWIVHLLRHSLEFANWIQRKPYGGSLAPDLDRGER